MPSVKRRPPASKVARPLRMSASLTPSGDVSPIHSDRAAAPLISICACEGERLVTNTDCAHAPACTRRPSAIPASAQMKFFIESAGLDVACFEADVHRSEEHTSELQSPCNLVC